MKRKIYLLLISVLVFGLMPMSLIKGETTPPTVNITSHSTNDDVSGSITITATASDSGSGIDFLQFYFGGDLISTDSSSPYSSTSITVKNYKEGAQTISVVAFDNDENFAVDNVIVNVVIYNYEYDDSDTETTQDYDSVWIWFHTYDVYIDDSEAYRIGGDIRKIEFDWYTDDDNGIVECKWAIWGDTYILNPEVETLDPPGSDPTHVKLIWGPDEFTKYNHPEYLHIQILMYRYSNLILTVSHELQLF